MIRIYFVDDDYLILDELKGILDYPSIGYEVVGSSNNPLTAKEEILSLQPEVIVTDIQMDALSGIGLTESLSESCPNSVFVFLSGYDKFDYAMEAIRLGVARFLRKPIKKAEFSSTLLDIRESIYSSFRERVLLTEARDPSAMETLFSTASFLPKAPYRVLCFNGIGYSSLLSKVRSLSSSLFELYHDDRICLVLAYSLDYPSLPSLEGELRGVSIGISNEQEAGDYSRIATLIRKTRIASKQRFISGKAEVSLYYGETPCPLAEKARSLSRLSDLEEFVDSLKSRLIQEHVSVIHLQKIYQGILLSMDRLQVASFDPEYSASVLDSYDSIDALICELQGYFRGVQESGNGEPVINEVKSMIASNLGRKLSMAEIASKYGYNVSYFSQLFKKVVGVSFIEYLTNLKIDRAKYRIAHGNDPLQSIALEVGYEDYYHFSKMFKKYTGFSPSDYREFHRK
ncbi:MAG: helix-turn-helix domain-containing protein [Candidatus Enteromonas sp.]|nr:helix-turn-helix domain-containing protein [Candidatus Enteromonas sp.]